MGAGLDVLTTCDGQMCQQDDIRAPRQGGRMGQAPGWADDALVGCAGVGCAGLEEATKNAVASVNRGGTKISEEVLMNHELLQHARQGTIKGLSAALDKGAWTETRRPLVMKPQKPEVVSDGPDDFDRKLGDKEPPPKKFADINPAEIGMTALMFSSQAGSVECIRRLLWANAEVNAVEEDGWTALHFAAKEAHFEACKALLQARADTNCLNAEDTTPLQVAKEANEDGGEFAQRFAVLLAKHS